jgi:hypothetical protein
MFSATDIASFLACPHTATLDRAESNDEIVKPFFKNPSVDLLRKLGLEHEQRYLLLYAGDDVERFQNETRNFLEEITTTAMHGLCTVIGNDSATQHAVHLAVVGRGAARGLNLSACLCSPKP